MRVRTLSCSDLAHRQGSSNVDQPAAVWHLILGGILTEIIIINRVNQTQVEQQAVQHLYTHTRVNTRLHEAGST